ncbi:MAG: CaiB/BaiF CoA transferase family protein [Myxococcota bacterium]
MADGALPLAGLKVLDLSRLLPGPYATLVLADLGATVDKLEDPDGGDYLRHMPPMVGEESALFHALNRNKRSIALDLKSPSGKATLRRLVRSYDVLVESFRPGVMDRLGVGYAVLASENPRLVYCALSGYGQTGPDRLKAGHDLNYVARAGVLGYGGTLETAAMPGAQLGDIGGGSLFALVGIFAALYERARTGKGRLVDVAMTEGAMAFWHMHLGAYLAAGKEAKAPRRGRDSLNGGYACYNLYRCQDGKELAVGALEPKFFSHVCAVLGCPELVEKAYDLEGGGAEEAKAELTRRFATQPRAHWLKCFADVDACVEPVNDADEVLEDRQLHAREMFVPAKDEQRGREVTHLRTPFHFGPLPTRPPPALGQHTEQILFEAGIPQPPSPSGGGSG